MGSIDLAINKLQEGELNGVALVTDQLRVQVEEVTRLALVECGLVTQGESTVVDGPASCVDSARLGWGTVELELLVGDNGTSTAMGVPQQRV